MVKVLIQNPEAKRGTSARISMKATKSPSNSPFRPENSLSNPVIFMFFLPRQW